MRKKRFDDDVVVAARDGKILGMRAGARPHRFIGIWVVVVGGRIFVRSWDTRANGWYRTLLEEPFGVMQIAGREIPFRAIHTRSERVKAAVSAAYASKYDTPGAVKYVRGFKVPRRKNATVELAPR